MKKLALLLVVALLFVASPVMAATKTSFLTGNGLADYCATIEDPKSGTFLDGLCLGFITGTMDSHANFLFEDNIKAKYCKPTKSTPGQMAKVVVKYLKNHPERLHFTASSLIYSAFSEAFPCP